MTQDMKKVKFSRVFLRFFESSFQEWSVGDFRRKHDPVVLDPKQSRGLFFETVFFFEQH